MKSYPLHTCHFFNIFVHSDYIEPNKGANLKLYTCSQEQRALLESPAGEPGCTPGFRVCLQTLVGYKYFLEVDARLIDGKDAFIYVESGDGTVRLVDRNENRFKPCEREYYSITFEAVSIRTIIGILFFCSDVKNTLRITNFRVAPFLDIDNFVDENVNQWKCVGGQLGFPSGCTACSPDDCPSISALFGGPPGPQGPQGVQGADGMNGPTGPTGAQGDVGPQGPTGEVGPAGPTGNAGVDGPPGLQGPPGSAGPIGPQGSTGPQGPIGVMGIQGPQGSQGATGSIGPQGDSGIDGPTGPTGPEGNQGEAGPTGPQGPTGMGVIGTWTPMWNRVTAPSPLTLEYQVVANVVTITLPGVVFQGDPGGDSIITTIGPPMPIEIRPNVNQTLIVIRSNSPGGQGLSRVNITSTGVMEISSDLENNTPFLMNQICNIPNSSADGVYPFTYSLF